MARGRVINRVYKRVRRAPKRLYSPCAATRAVCARMCARTGVSDDKLDSMSVPGGTRANEKRPAEEEAGQTMAQEVATYYREMEKLDTRLFELKTMALGMHPSSCAEAMQVTRTKILLIVHEASALRDKFSGLPGVPNDSKLPPEFLEMAARGSAIASRSQSNDN